MAGEQSETKSNSKNTIRSKGGRGIKARGRKPQTREANEKRKGEQTQETLEYQNVEEVI